MGAHHDHGHSHGNGRRSAKSVTRLKIALVLTALFMIAEAVGGWITNSLALIADAGHMFTDVAALSLTLFAIWFASRPATAKKTYGYYRLEILAAFINGVALVLLSIWIIWEAIERWRSPQDVMGLEMTLVAVGGLVINIIAAILLHSGQENDLNIRGAWLHVMGDLLGSIAAISAGILIIAFGWFWADAAISILISLIIIAGSWRLINESVNVLLEGTPRHIDIASVESAILETPGVGGVHDLHVWTISSGIDALSAHITHVEPIDHGEVLAVVRKNLHDRFGIDHLTIQIETSNNKSEAVYVCDTGVNCFDTTVRTKS